MAKKRTQYKGPLNLDSEAVPEETVLELITADPQSSRAICTHLEKEGVSTSASMQILWKLACRGVIRWNKDGTVQLKRVR